MRRQGSGSIGVASWRAGLYRPTLPIPAEAARGRQDLEGTVLLTAGEEYEIFVADESSMGAWRGLSFNIVLLFLLSVRVEAVIAQPRGDSTRAYWRQTTE